VPPCCTFILAFLRRTLACSCGAADPSVLFCLYLCSMGVTWWTIWWVYRSLSACVPGHIPTIQNVLCFFSYLIPVCCAVVYIISEGEEEERREREERSFLLEAGGWAGGLLVLSSGAWTRTFWMIRGRCRACAFLRGGTLFSVTCPLLIPPSGNACTAAHYTLLHCLCFAHFCCLRFLCRGQERRRRAFTFIFSQWTTLSRLLNKNAWWRVR